MKTDIIIVTWHRDLPFLKYALKSINKFAAGFHRVVVAVPKRDLPQFHYVIKEDILSNGLIDVKPFDEWDNKGFLHHEYIMMTAPDWCPGADFILHMDSDTIFTEAVTPETYFHGGKPVLLHASFDWLMTQQANLINWKVAAQNALGINVTEEIMRRHPAVHFPEVYHKARVMIETHTGKPMDQYIQAQQNAFPQTFAEYPTLGAVAWHHFKDRYHWINQETDPWPHNPLKQYWAQSGVTDTVLADFQRYGLV